jgi:uncharacterized OB-fold protein
LAAGRLELQRCAACAAVQYPPAEVCLTCLGDELSVARFDARGVIIAAARVHRSYRADFSGAEWPVASVKLDAGPVVLAHVADVIRAGTGVRLVALTDRLGDGVFGAVRDDEDLTHLQTRMSRTP